MGNLINKTYGDPDNTEKSLPRDSGDVKYLTSSDETPPGLKTNVTKEELGYIINTLREDASSRSVDDSNDQNINPYKCGEGLC